MLDHAPAPLPKEVEEALGQIHRLAHLAQENGIDPSELGPEALYWLARIFPAPPVRDPSSRTGWQVVLDWLQRAMVVPGIRELRDALDDLDRGVIREALQKPKGAGQGRRASKSDAKMSLLQIAIEAADEIGRRYEPSTRDEQIELTAGVPLDTLKRWRGMLDAAPCRFHPSATWYSIYGDADPVIVLRDAAASYRERP